MRTAIATGVLLALAAPAGADPSPGPTAASVYHQGEALYAAKAYGPAAERFVAAFALDPDPGYLFNAAQAYRLADACADAATYYRRFLAVATGMEGLDKVRAYIAQEDACVERTRVPPTPRREPAPPPPSPSPSPSAVRPADHHGLVLALGALGVVGLAGGIAGQVGVHGAETDFARHCAPSHPCANDDILSTLAQRGHRDSVLSITSFAVGGAALAGSLALYLVDRNHRATHELGVTPTLGGAMVVARGSF